MENRSSVNLKKKTGVNTETIVKNKMVVVGRSDKKHSNLVKVKKMLMQDVAVKNSGNFKKKKVIVSVNRNTKVRVKRG